MQTCGHPQFAVSAAGRRGSDGLDSARLVITGTNCGRFGMSALAPGRQEALTPILGQRCSADR